MGVGYMSDAAGMFLPAFFLGIVCVLFIMGKTFFLNVIKNRDAQNGVRQDVQDNEGRG
jgi:signal transduction histidine kinase